MKEKGKTKEELKRELAQLHHRVSELEARQEDYNKATAKLRESETRYRTIFENANDEIVYLDRSGKIIDVNERVEDIFGYRREEVIGKDFADLGVLQAERVSKMVELMEKAHRKRKSQVVELQAVHKNGHRIYVEANTRLIEDEGQVANLCVVIRDITERKKAEEALQESEMKFRIISESIREAIILMDKKERVSFWNPAAERIFGYSPQEALGKEIYKLIIPQKYHQAYLKGMRRFQNTGQGRVFNKPLELSGLRKDGSQFPAEISISPLQLKGEWQAVATVRDITERHRNEEKLKKEKEFSETLIQSIFPDVILVVGRDRRILRCNRAVEKMFGYLPQEIIGQKTDLLYEDRNRNVEDRPIRNILEKRGFHTGEANGRRKGGSHLDLEISTAVLQGEEGVVLLVRDITERKRAERILVEAKMRAEEAESALREKNNELRKANRELKEAQSQLLQREKLASIGQLAAGIAHEINNPAGFVSSNLNSLQGYISDFIKTLKEYEKLLSLCKQKEDKDLLSLAQQVEKVKKEVDLDFLLEDIEKTVGESLEGTERITKIVRDLKDFSHLDEAELKYANINEGIESTLNIVWNELKYKAEVIKEYGNLPDIECYPQQLNQVFMNLLVNAAQAIEERGQIRIRTYSDGGRVYVQISDTGVGIPQENLSRIFEPFFTTKEVGKGTGLGLSMSYGIIKKHQGKIDVESHLGEGTTFTIELPLRAARKGETPG